MRLNELFSWWARKAAAATGHPAAFALALLSFVVWSLAGKYFHYSDTWQLVINTATNLVTCLMVFLIQNSQNRDTLAIQIKLNEIIRALEGAHIRVLDMENSSEEELKGVYEKYRELSEEVHHTHTTDTGTPEIELPIKPKSSSG